MKIEKRDKIKGDKFIEDKKYLGILKYFMSDCNQIVDKINNVGFYESELSKIISKYNNYKNPQSKSISHLNHDQYVTKFGIRFGKIIGSLIYSDDSDWGHSANFSQIINYTGGCFINLAYKNFSIQPEILLTKKASTLLRKGSLWNQFTFISSSYLQVPISIYYSFQYKKFKPLISVGAIIGHAISQNTYRIENNNISQLLYYKDEYGFRGGLGLEYQLKNKFSIGLEYIYEYTVPNQNVFSTIEYKTQNITFRVSY
jgi:opacity protein-like surface antigen